MTKSGITTNITDIKMDKTILNSNITMPDSDKKLPKKKRITFKSVLKAIPSFICKQIKTYILWRFVWIINFLTSLNPILMAFAIAELYLYKIVIDYIISIF